MTREDIIRMAREAGLAVNFDIRAVIVEGVHINKELERFAALVAAQEREACAGVCDERAAKASMGSDEQCEAEDCAAAIRARGNK
jgi:hypothetical protein